MDSNDVMGRPKRSSVHAGMSSSVAGRIRIPAFLSFVAWLVSGALLGYAGVVLGRWLSGSEARTAAKSTLAREELLWLVLACAAGAFLAIALHELGHVLAGLSQGFRFYLYVVGPLKVSRVADRIEFGWNKSLQLAGGIAACVPVDAGQPDLAKRMAVMVAGGPLASLLIAAILFALGALFPSGGASRWFLGITALMSAAIFLATIVPVRTSSFHSDGARLLMYWVRRDAMTRWARSAALGSLALSSIAPRDWPEFAVACDDAAMDASLDGIGIASLLYYRELDCGNLEGAAAYLDHFLAHREAYPEPFRPALCLEGAWFEGTVRKRPAEARAWLDQSNGGLIVEPHSRLRAEASVLLAEGRLPEARSKVDEALSMLDRMKTRVGFHEAERRMLERTRAAME
jgi:hypothetical protein